jgi:hypothetical protein
MPISTGSLSVPQLGQNIDANIYGNKQASNAMSLGDMVGLARGVQAYKQAEEVNPELAKQSKVKTLSDVTATKKSQFELQKLYTDTSYTEANALLNDDRIKNLDPNNPKSVHSASEAITHATDRMIEKGVPKNMAYMTASKYFEMLKSNPQNIMAELKNSTLAQAGPATAQQLQTPQYTTNAAGNIVGLKAGPNEISAPIEAGQPQMQPQGGATGQVQNQFNQRIPLNPGTAQAGMINTQAANYATDFTQAQNTASNSEPRIALFQNIKKLSSDAFTGVGGARKELASGIAQAVGIDIFQAEKMSTDELAKSSAMLSLAGGNTDMARQMAEAANPNKKMNEKAIKEIADQMIGMERLNQAKVKFLAPVANNPQAYAQKLQQFNQINDFRIFQESTPDQIAKLKASMSPLEQQRMGEKIRLARQMELL